MAELAVRNIIYVDMDPLLSAPSINRRRLLFHEI